MIAALAGADIAGDVAAVALAYTDDQDELEPAAVHVATQAHRAAVLAGAAPEEAFDAVWDLSSWPIVLDLVPWPSDTEGFGPANDAVRDALERAGVNPVRWTLARVAQALMGADLPVARATDFVVVPFDPAHADHLPRDAELAAPAAVAASLRRQRLLEVGGPPLARSELTAYVDELPDEDDGWLGRFQCAVEGGIDDSETGPDDAELADALAWARARADEVHLTVGDEEYSAGSRAIAGLPAWPDGQTVSARSGD